MKAETISGISLIAAERERQVSMEGWTPEHDDQHKDGGLALAAADYAFVSTLYQPRTDGYDNELKNATDFKLGTFAGDIAHNLWPWDFQWWKPKAPIRDLVRAGALIAAEIDRRLHAGETLEGA